MFYDYSYAGAVAVFVFVAALMHCCLEKFSMQREIDRQVHIATATAIASKCARERADGLSTWAVGFLLPP